MIYVEDMCGFYMVSCYIIWGCLKNEIQIIMLRESRDIRAFSKIMGNII